MKRVISILLTLLLAGAAGSGVYYFSIYRHNRVSGGGRVSSTSEDAVYVDSVRIIAGLDSGSGLISRYAGVVEPQQTWEAKLESEKTVKETYVKEGDEVKVGDKLFTYDTSEDEDKLAQAQIDLERNESDLEQKKFQLASWERQKPKDNATDEVKLEYTAQLLGYQNDVKQTEYEIKTGRLELEQLQASLDSADVYCELEGVVKSIKNPNSTSSYGYYGSDTSDAYITVMAVGDYRVKGTINEQNIYDISEGEEMLAFSRVDDQVWHGVITEINTDSGDSNQNMDYYFGGDSSDGDSTNYPFYVMLDDSQGLLLGQHVYLEPDMGQSAQRDGIWLPEYYFFFERDGSARVWAASEDNKLTYRKVEVGDYDEDMGAYQVIDGLTGEDYITVPTDELSEGLPVIYVDYSEGQDGGESLYDEDFDDGSFYWDDEDFDEGSFYWDDEWDEADEEDEDLYYDEGSYDDFDEGSYDYTPFWDEDEERAAALSGAYEWEAEEVIEVDE